jgi:hypothetical protein
LPQVALAAFGSPYMVAWVMAVALLSAAVDRWYQGAEWYGLVAGLRRWVVAGGIGIGLGLYTLWLWWAGRVSPAEPAAAQLRVR